MKQTKLYLNKLADHMKLSYGEDKCSLCGFEPKHMLQAIQGTREETEREIAKKLLKSMWSHDTISIKTFERLFNNLIN